MREIHTIIRNAASWDANVCIEGENGTGKELVARSLHVNGPRRDRPFVTLDCSTIPEDLFGEVPGAFTGAAATLQGVFAQAHTGTLFIKGIDKLSASSQARLLRLIQTGELTCLAGSARPRYWWTSPAREAGASRWETSMRWIGKFLIVLALSSLGCARGDWVSETLPLVDVTGTWEGAFHFGPPTNAIERRMRWVLQQKGPQVRGEVQGLDGAPLGSVEGLVNGEAFNWQMTAIYVRWMNAPSRSYIGEGTVNSDELSGRANGFGCPKCTILLHRVGPAAR